MALGHSYYAADHLILLYKQRLHCNKTFVKIDWKVKLLNSCIVLQIGTFQGKYQGSLYFLE